jgi:pantoate--beta-alanine ligase
VVTKLFQAVEPDKAFFGQKDAAQHAVIRRMVRDLDLPVEVRVGEIVREPDGLAMSSRNVYLSPEERKRALVLHHALARVRELANPRTVSAPELIAAAQQVFATEPDVRVDYIAIVDPDELTPLPDVNQGALVAVAAFVGTTRLIDNIVLPPVAVRP